MGVGVGVARQALCVVRPSCGACYDARFHQCQRCMEHEQEHVTACACACRTVSCRTVSCRVPAAEASGAADAEPQRLSAATSARGQAVRAATATATATGYLLPVDRVDVDHVSSTDARTRSRSRHHGRGKAGRAAPWSTGGGVGGVCMARARAPAAPDARARGMLKWQCSTCSMLGEEGVLDAAHGRQGSRGKRRASGAEETAQRGGRGARVQAVVQWRLSCQGRDS